MGTCSTAKKTNYVKSSDSPHNIINRTNSKLSEKSKSAPQHV